MTGMLVAVAACAGTGGDGAGEATVRDSSGITIVENAGGVWAPGSGWSLGAEPMVQLGGNATEPSYDFSQVTGALMLGNGSIAVANSSSSEIRFFDAAGVYQFASGRQGSGPGEYGAITGMFRTPADSLVVLDILVRRLTVLGPDGGVGRSFSLGGLGGAMVPGADGSISMSLPAGLLDDGSLVGVSLGLQINAERAGNFRDSMPAIRFGPDGAVLDTLGWFPGIEMQEMTLNFGGQSISTPTGVPLGRNTLIVAAGSRVYVATNDRFEVEVREPAGRLTSLIRANGAPRELKPDGVALHRKDQVQLMDANLGAGLPPQLRDQMVEHLNTVAYPTTLPFIANILLDDAGNLWVQEQDQPGDRTPRFAVFDATGRLQGWVDMPERFQPTQIRSGKVIGIWRDQDDVEHVRVYALNRGS
ncbi:MAG: hypothetical protein SGI84_04030 [Gemmatimonadota bacterium]|nr:hypothetical protein [Gemmatimonadota bacterium]